MDVSIKKYFKDPKGEDIQWIMEEIDSEIKDQLEISIILMEEELSNDELIEILLRLMEWK